MARLVLVLAALLLIAQGLHAADTVVINEVMAKNAESGAAVMDEDRQYKDWIELYNTTASNIDLAGYYLTDDAKELTKWKFPATNINANGYLLVFASEKDRAVSGKELHTNFKLSKDYGFLALVAPDGKTILSAYAPYPPQALLVSYGSNGSDLATRVFFSVPSPRAANGTGAAAVSVPPQFSRASGAYGGASITVEISTPSLTSAIRYTTNGSIPTAASTLYSNPLTITVTTVIRAKTFESGSVPSETATNTFVMLDPSMESFSSNLPITIINSFGGSVPGSNTPVSAQFIDTNNGRAFMTGAPDLVCRGTTGPHGHASSGVPKFPIKFTTVDEIGNNFNTPVLGLPEHNDWDFFNPYADKTLMRNVLIYGWGNAMGQYSPRTRFMELFINTSAGGRLTMNDYRGVYVLMELIRQDKTRVDIAKLLPSHNTEPDITGGYVLRRDYGDGDVTFTTPYTYPARNGGILSYKDPRGTELTTEQRNYIYNYVLTFENSMGPANFLQPPDANFADPINGYAKHIDVNSFVDFHLITEYVRNEDGFRKSNYMHKDRNGKFKQGPLWDYDASMGNTVYARFDGSDNGITGWYWQILVEKWGYDSWNTGQVPCDYPWFWRLFQDPDFAQKWEDRWVEMRRGMLSTPNVNATIDGWASYLNEAQVRNFQKWNILGQNISPNAWVDGSYPAEVAHMKQFMQTRSEWIDGQFPAMTRRSQPVASVAPPVFSQNGGTISPGFNLGITASNGTIYYTLDGTDPRVWGPGVAGNVSAAAQTYAGPVALNQNTLVFARAKNGTTWSAPTKASFITGTPPLVITEIMYHPAPQTGSAYFEDDFEFIELKNVGATPLNLKNYAFTNGIEYTFGNVTLGAGDYTVLVKNAAAFAERYGVVQNVAGTYTGTLDNNGERLCLAGSAGETILDFSYSDGWYRATDGLGFSLVIKNDLVALNTWGDKESWRVSGVAQGSPGEADIAVDIGAVIVNEILTHTLAPDSYDKIELYNPTNNPVNIGGWYLSDNSNKPKKFRIPGNTVIPANDYWSVDSRDFGGQSAISAFQISSQGDDVALFSGDPQSGALTGYSHVVSFNAAEFGVSFGRHETSDHRIRYPAQRRTTFGAVNSVPRVGPVIISEIMFYPANGKDEFIELLNISENAVALFNAAESAHTWRISGIDFNFPPNVVLQGGKSLLVVQCDPAVFRAKYSIPADIQIFGPFAGGLKNDHERLELQWPDATVIDAVSGIPAIPYVTMDEVEYNTLAPWPMNTAGTGDSLERTALMSYGDDPANWSASKQTGGTPGVTPSISVITFADSVFTFSESLGTISIPVVLQPTISATVTANIEINGALSGITLQTQSIQFAPGESVRFVDVVIAPDTLDQPDRTFVLKLNDEINAFIGEFPDVNITITDDDPPPSMQLNDFAVFENGGIASISVSLSAASGKPISVEYTTVSGSASPLSDYITNSGTLNFAPGVTEQTIVISIIDDAIFEYEENFTLQFSNTQNATLPKTTLSVAIKNDDPEPKFKVNGTVLEGGTPLANVTVSDGTRSAVTDAQGKYSISNVPLGTLAFFPTLRDYSFLPSSRTVTFTPTSTDLVNQDYAATRINFPPVIISGPSANPSLAQVNEPVQFSCPAADESSMLWLWRFGDGTEAAVGTDTTLHSYVTAGNYIATVIISDDTGLSIQASVPITVISLTDLDADGDFYSDEFELSIGTNPHDPNSRPGGSADFDHDGSNDYTDKDDDNDLVPDFAEIAAGTDPWDANSVPSEPLAVLKIQGAISIKPGKDSFAISGSFPNPPQISSLASKQLLLRIGGADVLYYMDAKGKGVSTLGKFALQLKPPKKGSGVSPTLLFTASAKNGSFAASWADEGVVLTSTQTKPIQMSVEILANEILYRTSVTCQCVIKGGKSATFKH